MIEVQRRNGNLVQSELHSQEVYSRRLGENKHAYDYIVDGYDKVVVVQDGSGAWVEKCVIENLEPPKEEDVEEVFQKCVEFEQEFEGERLVHTVDLTNGQLWVEHENGERSEWGEGYIYKCLSSLIKQGRISTNDKLWTLKICK